MTVSLLLIAACSQPGSQKPHLSLKPSVECRTIQHEFGETCVPLKPQRIVALSPETTLDPLIALGIQPVGFTSYYSAEKGEEVLYGVSFDQISGADNVGNVYQPSLEKILKLKPDLILSCCDEHLYEPLSAIAPTVAVPAPYNAPANKAYFKENLRYVARVIGEETKAEEVLNQYQEQIEQLKQRLGNQLQTIEIAVLFYRDADFWTLSGKNNELVTNVFNDIGLRYQFLPHGGRNVKLSIEAIGEFDADILFIADASGKAPSFYFQNPLIKNLEAVKKGRAYIVNQEAWDTQGISGANQVLDDLFKYLVDQP
jgi:iron complex transport system substrate-binding protein